MSETLDPRLDRSPSRDDSPATLAPGTIAAERFRVIAFVARGGMGEVYEAEDAALGERVALKTIRPELAAEPGAVERFKREIQLARRVTHPNVSRVFDFWIDRARGPFVTMELLRGESLEQRIALGALAPTEALPVARHMIEGLAAAHAAGVVHRDFKSGNVMLVAASDGSRSERAVVTDFGLALAPHAPHAAPRERMLGSPGYLAPEQIAGEPITAATDVFALGVVLFEMLTGDLPFGDDSSALADPTSGERALSVLRARAPRLDAPWMTVAARCLERDPARRFASASEIIAALDATETAARPRFPLATAVIAGALAVAAIVGLEVSRRGESGRAARTEGEIAGVSSPRASVAVLDFHNDSGSAENAWLATAFTELFSRELAAGDRLRILPRDEIFELTADLGIANAESLSQESLARLRKTIDADYLLTGAFECASHEPAQTPMNASRCETIRLALRLQDASGGAIVASLRDSSAAPELRELVARACVGLRDYLGVVRLTSAEAATTRAA